MEYNAGNPYGRIGFNMGVANRNMQIRVRRKTREEAKGVGDEIKSLIERGANEDTVPLPSGSVVIVAVGNNVMIGRDKTGVVFSISYRVTCPS